MYTLVVVDYNGLKKTLEYVKLCLSALGTDGAGHAVVVENGDCPEESALLEAAFGRGEVLSFDGISVQVFHYRTENQEILYVRSGENLGYAKGNNLGITLAQRYWNDPFCIVSNNDLEFPVPVDLNAVQKVFDEHPEVGVIGPRVVTPEGEVQSPRRWRGAFSCLAMQHWIGVLGKIFGARGRKKVWNVCCGDVIADAQNGVCPWVSGCFMFLRMSLFAEAGMFDPHTFLYAEEKILSKRMERVGGQVYYLSDVQVVHRHGETTKKAMAFLRMARIGFESDYYFYKEYTKTPRWILGISKGFFRLFETFFRLLKKD